MQTFLPYPDFAKTASILDYRRLGNQRIEARQIINVLEGKTTAWQHHPIVRMWCGHTDALKHYFNIISQEWMHRGYKHNIDATEVSGSKVNYPNKLTILESCLARPGNVETVFKFSDDGTQPLEVVISGFIDIDSISKATNIAEIGIVTGGARGTNTRVAFNGRSYSSWLDSFGQFWHCSRI